MFLPRPRAAVRVKALGGEDTFVVVAKGATARDHARIDRVKEQVQVKTGIGGRTRHKSF